MIVWTCYVEKKYDETNRENWYSTNKILLCVRLFRFFRWPISSIQLFCKNVLFVWQKCIKKGSGVCTRIFSSNLTKGTVLALVWCGLLSFRWDINEIFRRMIEIERIEAGLHNARAIILILNKSDLLTMIFVDFVCQPKFDRCHYWLDCCHQRRNCCYDCQLE